jgi:hypothetical protein
MVACKEDNENPANGYRLKEWFTSHSYAVSTRIVYDYQDDRIVMHRNYYADSSQYARVEYYYENDSIEQRGYDNFNGEWVESVKNLSEYDESRMVRYSLYTNHYGIWVLAGRAEYTYSEGLLTRESWSVIENEIWKELSYTLYYYVDNLPIKSEIFARLEDDVMRKLTRKEADYNGNKLNSIFSFDYLTDSVNSNFKNEFHYENGQLVRIDNFSYENEWIPAGGKEFTYDASGNLASVVRKNAENTIVDLDEYIYEPGKGNYEQIILPGGGLISETNLPHPTKIAENQYLRSNLFLLNNN